MYKFPLELGKQAGRVTLPQEARGKRNRGSLENPEGQALGTKFKGLMGVGWWGREGCKGGS